MLKTEYTFTLPLGFVDPQGNLHKNGVMRLATARDEVEPLSDPRVKNNEAYLGVLVLSRVVSRLGEISPVPPAIIEGLFSADYNFLQQLYLRINDLQEGIAETRCPSCGTRFAVDLREAAV